MTMGSAFVADHGIADEFAALFGAVGPTFEHLIYHFARDFTIPDTKNSLTQYCGGRWCLERVQTDPNKVFFWFRLDGTQCFHFFNENNYSSEILDAELLSMVVNLMAASVLCCRYFQQLMQAEGAHEPQSVIDVYRARNELMHDLYHGLLAHFLEKRIEHQERRNLLVCLLD